jgi:L-lactate dehydrogenase complex protein LldF
VVDARRASSKAPSAERALMAAAAYAMDSPGRWTAALRTARLGRLLGGRRRKISALPPPLSAWTGTRDAPLPPTETFRDWWARRRRAGGAGP